MKSALVILVICCAQAFAGVEEPCYFSKTLAEAQQIIAKADPDWQNQLRAVYTKWSNCPDIKSKLPTTKDLETYASVITNIAKLYLQTVHTSIDNQLDYLKNKLQDLPVDNIKLSQHELINVQLMEKMIDYIIKNHEQVKARTGIDVQSKNDVLPYIDEVKNMVNVNFTAYELYLEKSLTETIQPNIQKYTEQLCQIRNNPNVVKYVPEQVLNLIVCDHKEIA